MLNKKIVFITVAGRSNALSGFVAANSLFPASLQMPSKVPVMTVIDPENAVLAALRILSD